MRHYQCDSPEAGARIVAACLLSDGHVGKDEMEALDRHGIEQRLSLRPRQFLAIVQTLCEDLSLSQPYAVIHLEGSNATAQIEESRLDVLIVARETWFRFIERQPGQQGDAIKILLAMRHHVVAQCLDRLPTSLREPALRKQLIGRHPPRSAGT